MERKSQNFVTICTRIIERKTSEELDALDNLIYETLGNLKKDTVEALNAVNLIHFASMNVIKGYVEKEPSYILLEMTVDGDPDKAIRAFALALPEKLIKIYQGANASIKTKAAVIRQLLDDQYEIKRSPLPSFFHAQSLNGLPFSGTSGLDLDDVTDDANIAQFARDLIQEKKGLGVSDVSLESDDQGPNRPLDVFRYVKKHIVEQSSDFTLSQSWKRASARKKSPNFAESMSSNWKERWSQVKLFVSIVPAWIWTSIALTYLIVLTVLTDQTSNSDMNTACGDWDKVRYSGSPFFKLEKSLPNCLSLESSFLLQGGILSILLFAILRYSPLPIKRPSVSLTLLTGMGIYLLFPNTFDINKFDETIALQRIWWNLLILLWGLAGLYAVIFFTHKIIKSGFLRGWFLSLTKLFNRFHQWIYFTAAIALCLLLSFMGLRFFYGHALGGIFSHPEGLVLPLDGVSSKFPQYEFANKFCLKSPADSISSKDLPCSKSGKPRPTQFLFIPIIISGIFILSLQAIAAHTPRELTRLFSGSLFSEKLGAKLKPHLSKIWSIIFLLVAFMIFKVGFVASNLDVPRLVFDVFIRIIMAILSAVISTQILKAVSPSEVNLKKVFFGFSALWVLVLFSKYLFTGTTLNVFIYVISAIPITVVLTALVALIWLGLFLVSQSKNQQRYDNPYTDVTREIFNRESRVSQNNMISIQRLVPDVFRKNIALPLMLNAIYGVLGRQRFRPGFLANVGTVHSARWLHLPDTDNYVFIGNYDGSFESYLEDFSKMAIEGTNLAWGNCIGFPKIRGIFKGGVEDSDRFKRYARRSMKPTSFWYSAVSDKSAEQIRRNALIRDGLTQDSLSASEAQAWLDLFGSIPRPEWVLETDEIQNIVFGGNGSLRFGGCFVLERDMSSGDLSAKGLSEWVDKIRPHITFTEQKQTKKSVYVAFSAKGLRELGLEHVLDEKFEEAEHHMMPKSENQEYPINFSQPFVSGMADRSRRNVLGDHGDSDSEKWSWSDQNAYAVVLIYADTEEDLNSEFSTLKQFAGSGIRLKEIKRFREKASAANLEREPFGFADGISQPILKGTARGRKHAKSIHIVEPGEFILGYRDNGGHFPPSPVIEERHDVLDILPNQTTDLIQRYPNFSSPMRSSHRSLGRNGSYLVIRELYQDVDGFHKMSRQVAKDMLSKRIMPFSSRSEIYLQSQNEPPLAYIASIANPEEQITVDDYAERIECLLMGRHKDGTSLIDREIEIEQNSGEAIQLKGDSMTRGSTRPVKDLKRENEFLFRDTDPQGHKCPFGSHVRRANPRDGLMLDSEDGLAVSQRHRILRRGRAYGTAGDEDQGIFFMCLNADIDRQFEFLQQTWLMSSKFHGLSDEVDPIVGQAKSKDEAPSHFTIQHPDGDIRIPGLQKFVTMKGGGYFFMPGKSCLDFFASLKDAPIKRP